MSEVRVLQFEGDEVRVFIDGNGDCWWSLVSLLSLFGKNEGLEAIRKLPAVHKQPFTSSLFAPRPMTDLGISHIAFHHLIMDRTWRSQYYSERLVSWVMNEANPKLRQSITDDQREQGPPKFNHR